MLKHRLSSDDLENDYTLIAIHSNTEPYKLAFEINQKLNYINLGHIFFDKFGLEVKSSFFSSLFFFIDILHLMDSDIIKQN